MSPYRTNEKPDEADAPKLEPDSILEALQHLAIACAMHNGSPPRIDLDEAAFDALVDELGSRIVYGDAIHFGKHARYVTIFGPRGFVRIYEVSHP